jgi:phospholipid/cholesterol/gamma-HCH transport system permease protein
MQSRSESADETWHVERAGGVVRLSGDLRTRHATSIVEAVRQVTATETELVLDLCDVEHIDGGVVALLLSDAASRGIGVIPPAGESCRSLFALYAGSPQVQPRPRRTASFAAQLGLSTLREVAEFDRLVSFIGEATYALARIVREPRRVQWKAIPVLLERAGMDALPVILILNFLIGFVMAYMSARALSMFGANLYVADLVGIAMTRQLAPLMTAIIVCGRSGAAFAAELGSMKVSEEIDALKTLGLEPIGWLVIPRVLALVLVMPVLTILADLVGLLGGLVVAVTSLGLTTKTYFKETRVTLEPWDVESGLWMSLAFALSIGFIACQQGLAASQGAQGVGRRTTKTVVSSLFAIVLLDAVFTVFYRTLGLS